LEGIPPSPRGLPQIEVTFDVDANGILHVSAKDKASGKEQRITIQSSGGLSDAEIEKMVKDAEANASADEQKKGLIESKNKADSIIHSTEKSLKEYGDKIPADEKTAIEQSIVDLKTAMEKDDLEAINQGVENVTQASMKIGQHVYSQSTENPTGDFAEDATSKTQDEKVVDADFEEVKDDEKK
jgi:molecular chaperone DnaK